MTTKTPVNPLNRHLLATLPAAIRQRRNLAHTLERMSLHADYATYNPAIAALHDDARSLQQCWNEIRVRHGLPPDESYRPR